MIIIIDYTNQKAILEIIRKFLRTQQNAKVLSEHFKFLTVCVWVCINAELAAKYERNNLFEAVIWCQLNYASDKLLWPDSGLTQPGSATSRRCNRVLEGANIYPSL